jgi:hypothetical protein
VYVAWSDNLDTFDEGMISGSATDILTALTSPQKKQITKMCSKDVAQVLLIMWQMIEVARDPSAVCSVWRFMDFMETVAARALQLVVPRRDKRKDKSMALSIKLALIGSMRQEHETLQTLSWPPSVSAINRSLALIAACLFAHITGTCLDPEMLLADGRDIGNGNGDTHGRGSINLVMDFLRSQCMESSSSSSYPSLAGGANKSFSSLLTPYFDLDSTTRDNDSDERMQIVLEYIRAAYEVLTE